MKFPLYPRVAFESSWGQGGTVWVPLTLFIGRQLVHQMGLGRWQSKGEGWLGKDGGRARAWWPVEFCHLSLCAFLFSPWPSPNPPPTPPPRLAPPPLRLRAPQVARSVWWWKASVMDLFCIQAQLNWCDSSPLSLDQPLYCLCLRVNTFWVNEFHYRPLLCMRVCKRVCVFSPSTRHGLGYMFGQLPGGLQNVCMYFFSQQRPPPQKRVVCGVSEAMLRIKKRKKKLCQNSLSRQTICRNNPCTASPHVFADRADF